MRNISLLLISLSVGQPAFTPYAYAEVVVQNSNIQTPTVTSNTISTPTIINQAPLAAPTQTQAQQNTQRENNDGSKQAKKVGGMAIMAGMAMMVAGAAMMAFPPTAAAGAALLAAGAQLLASGKAAMGAAGKMSNNAGKAGYNAGNMSNISQTPVSGTGKNDSGNIKIDPSLMRDPKAAKIVDDLQKKTGMSIDDIANALNDGKSVGEIIGPKTGMSADKIDSMIAGATPMGSEEALAKMGLTAEDLGDDANSFEQGGGERKLASVNPLDGLFAGKTDLTGASVTDGIDMSKLSPDVQAALDKNGITSKSIFEMVSSQYKRKTPMLFGVHEKAAPTTENPFANLKGNGLDI